MIHGQSGLVVDIDSQQIYEAIKNFINDKKLYKKIKDNLQKETIQKPQVLIDL
ncbi:hypothetical protein [Bacillus sp. T3]|uniref:hypothetical protein n=1 Tax=Bacillus sp. T3 TaxID=467262 RepID=UPI0029819F64|nr:hypothetical protein [Bacillus sp. T3]